MAAWGALTKSEAIYQVAEGEDDTRKRKERTTQMQQGAQIAQPE